MALKPKDSNFQFRVESDVLDSFREICEGRGMTVSQGLRRFMHDIVERERILKARGLKTE